MLTREQFIAGPPKTPWPLRGDAYTVSSDSIVSPKAKQRSVYNFTNRRSPIEGLPKGVAKDGRMVLYGLTDFIQRELTTPVTTTDIAVSELFMRDARIDGHPLDFDASIWRRIIREYNGYLPIKIEALPECSTFWVNEPVIQVTSLEEGFGEIAAIIEATLVGYVANATARLTLTRHLLERVRDVVRKYNPSFKADEVDNIAQWMIHDFGMRASSTSAESEIYGKAHLLCFNGTDTFNGAFQAWAGNAQRPIGTSILALAHRIVMGYDREEEAYMALRRATEDSIGSYVADCYDFHNAVKKFLIAIAKRGNGTIVARPDSGDYLENILFIVQQALEHDLYKTDQDGKPVATSLRFIQGDSMTWEKIDKVFRALERQNVNPTGWGIFGIGGWLRNIPNRDTLSSAYKLSAIGRDDQPVIKLSDTRAKMSIPGPNCLVRFQENQPFQGPTVYLASEEAEMGEALHPEIGWGYNSLFTYYDGSGKGPEAFDGYCLEDFNTLRYRCINGFDDYADVPANRTDVFSHRVLKIQNEAMKKYNKSYRQ